MLAIFAEKDEYADRPADDIVRWFEMRTQAPLQSMIVKKTGHSFKGPEDSIAKTIKAWIVK